MGKDPGAIREEIAATRAGMADTVDAIAYKSDIKKRSKDKVRSMTSAPRDAVLRVKDNVLGTVQEHVPDRAMVHDAADAIQHAPGQVADGAKRMGGAMRENPVGLALGGLAVGFVAGLVLPSTRIEDTRIGPMADNLKDQARETGQEYIEQGREVAQQAVSTVQDSVMEAGSEAMAQVKESLPSADSGDEPHADQGIGSSEHSIFAEPPVSANGGSSGGPTIRPL